MDYENSGIPATMLVGPTGYGNGGGFGNGGFGGDGWWVLLLLLAFSGGWGGFGGGFGGYGNMQLGYDFPWLLNGQNGINSNVSGGFRDQMIHDSITSVGDKVTSGFGDVALGIAGINQNLCQTGNSVVSAVTGAQNAISTQMYNNELASLNRSFAEQTANTAGFTGVNSGLADLKYVVATENCADRTAAATNTRDIIDSQTRGTQAILDKLCALELDGAKREAADLRQQLNMAQLAASQTAQNAFIQQGFANEVDALYNRLNSCPIPATPVYGRTQIFTCPNNNYNYAGCGCGVA